MNDQSEQRGNDRKEEKRYEHVLIPVSNPDTAEELVRLACSITTPASILHIVNVTPETSFTDRTTSWRKSSKLVVQMTHVARRLGRVANPKAVTSQSIADAVVKTAEEIEADLIIMGWFGKVIPVAVRKSRVVNKVLHRAGCDTAVLKSRGQLQEVKRIIFPVGPKFDDERFAALKAFRRIRGTEVVFVNVLTPGTNKNEEQAREILSEYANQLSGPAESRVIHSRNVVEGILSIAEKQDLIVIGPGREWVFNRFLFGLRADQITNRAPCSVLLYKSREVKVKSWIRGLFKAAWMSLSSSGKE
ncbi:MAG: universal stress protein [Candidatus Krumholzibacteriales bacterium]